VYAENVAETTCVQKIRTFDVDEIDGSRDCAKRKKTYSVFQIFRLIIQGDYFELILIIFEASSVIFDAPGALKSNQHNQVKLVQISDTHCTL